jgi:hypothetical protein
LNRTPFIFFDDSEPECGCDSCKALQVALDAHVLSIRRGKREETIMEVRIASIHVDIAHRLDAAPDVSDVPAFVPEPPRKSKSCSACHSWLPLAAFGADRSRTDGLTHRCRRCNSAYTQRRARVSLGSTTSP